MSKLETEQRTQLENEYEALIKQGGPREGQTEEQYAKELFDKAELLKLYLETDELHSILTSPPDVRGDYEIADVANTDQVLADAEGKSKASNEDARQRRRKIIIGVVVAVLTAGALAASGGSFAAATPQIIAAVKLGFNALSTTQ